MSTKQPVALAQECADYATSLRSTINVVKLEGRTAPISFLRAAELFERAAARIAELEALAAGYAAARLEIESLHAQFEAVGAAPWQPIATAPKDGSEILLRSNRGRIANGMWSAANERSGFWAWAYVQQEPVEWMPLPSAQALDAKRYQFLRDGEWRDTDLGSFIRLQLNTLWDAKIDAAIAAKQGVK